MGTVSFPWVGRSGGDDTMRHGASIQGRINRALLEVGGVQPGKVSFFRRQIVEGEDCVLCADACAVAAIDALIRIDEYLGDGSGGGSPRGRNGSGGALRHADEILVQPSVIT